MFISHFKSEPSWKTEEARRAFFDEFAASKGADHRDPLFWSGITVTDLLCYRPVRYLFPPTLPPSLLCFIYLHFFFKGYRSIAPYYGGQLSTCLMQLYPDIGLTQSHFDSMCHLFILSSLLFHTNDKYFKY